MYLLLVFTGMLLFTCLLVFTRLLFSIYIIFLWLSFEKYKLHFKRRKSLNISKIFSFF
jgi:hypothetical protein